MASLPDPDEVLGWRVKTPIARPTIELSPEMKARADAEWRAL